MPRPQHAPLTDATIKALKPEPIPYDRRDGEVRGLLLTVLPSGRKQWTLRYRAKGKQRRLVLGDYGPQQVTIAKARKLARGRQTGIDQGADPAAERQAARKAPGDTVAGLVDAYLKHAEAHKRSAAEDRRILERDVLPRWQDRSVRELTRRDVRAIIEAVADRGAPIMANRTLAVVRKMLNYAVDHDWIDASPAARVQKPAPEQERDRVLTDDEIRRLWRCLGRTPTTAERPAPGRKGATGDGDDPICPLSPTLAATLKVRLLTAQRGGEVAAMTWADLELPEQDGAGGWWTIPGTVTKNGETHRVYLVPEAVALILAQRPTDDDGHVLTPAPSAIVFSRDGDSTTADRMKKAASRLSRVLGFEFRGHDLRRTASTNMGAAGIPREHIAYVLNHADRGARATRIYDRYSHDREKQIALEAWARRLRGILKGKPAKGDVLAFAKGGA
jgi:integrase